MCKKELNAKYQQALALVKEKFEKKKVGNGLEVQVPEVVATELLKDLMAKGIDDAEILQMKEKQGELEKDLETKLVSDFLMSKLNMPQVSKDSGDVVQTVPGSIVPQGLDQFGSNVAPQDGAGGSAE